MNSLDNMIDAYNALDNNSKEYAEKYLPNFDTWFNYNLNHWTNTNNDSDIAMEKTIAEFTAWFNALANNNYGLKD